MVSLMRASTDGGEQSGLVDPPTRDGVPLKERVRPGSAPSQEASPAGGGRRRHCWVDLTGHRELSHPGEVEGLILQWAQDGDGWVALCAFVLPRSGGDLTVQQWVPAARLRPA